MMKWIPFLYSMRFESTVPNDDPSLYKTGDDIPRWDMEFIKKNEHKPVTELVQLSYVLPNESLVLLPQKIHIRLLKNMKECYPMDCKLEWSFCKYIWESHVHLPSIDIDKLEYILNK